MSQSASQRAEKKTTIETVEPLFPVIMVLIEFLDDFYHVFDSRDTAALESFIKKYRGHDIDSLSQFAHGLLDDYDAVRNNLIYDEVSNGPAEGLNNKSKMIKRRSYGRAGVELLNAYAVL